MALEIEIQTYQEALPTLMTDEGKYALVHQKEVSVYDTYEDAIKAGYEKYALKPFLVKKIQSVEQVQYFTRNIAPCHT